MAKRMPDKVLKGIKDILFLIPDTEAALDIIEGKIDRFGTPTEKDAFKILVKNLAEIQRLARDARWGEYRPRGEHY